MRVFELRGSFGLENLRLTQRPDPEPGAGQVRIAMKAASINYRDLLMVRGFYNPRQKLPLVPLSDGAGVVDAVGEGVTRFRVGDRVTPCFFQAWHARPMPRDLSLLKQTLGGPLDGTLAEKMVVPQEAIVRSAETLTDLEASTLTCAPLTAWSALITQGNLTAGDVLVVQGTGGVSLSALQIGVMVGARVIVTSSSPEKLERAKAMGAHETIDYRAQPEWGKVVRELTNGEGADHVIEVGGAGTLAQSIRATRPGGTISIIGVLAGTTTELNVIPVLMQNIRLQGVVVGTRVEHEAMNRAFVANGVKPVVDQVLPFEQAREAIDLLSQAKHFGKICISFE